MISITISEIPVCPRCNKATFAKKGWLNDGDATSTVTWECFECRMEIERTYRIEELRTDKQKKEAEG